MQLAVIACLKARGHCTAGPMYFGIFGGGGGLDTARPAAAEGSYSALLLPGGGGDEDVKLPPAEAAAGSSFIVNRFVSLRVSYARTLIRICMYGYTSCATLSLSFFHCQSMGSFGSVMYDYPAVSCDSWRYRSLIPLFATLLLTLVVFPPALLAVVLYRERERVALRVQQVHCRPAGIKCEPPAAAVGLLARLADQLDILYTTFRPGCSWYTLVILLRRLLLVTVFVFAPSASRFAALTAVNGAVLALHTAYWPYQAARDNRTELATLSALFLQCIVILVRPLPWTATSGGELAVTVLLYLLLMVAPAVLVLASAIQETATRCSASVGGGLQGWRQRQRQRQRDAGTNVLTEESREL
jgi:hypothetical protein